VSIAEVADVRHDVDSLLDRLSLREKIGQLVQVGGNWGSVSDELREKVASGLVGSVINEVDPGTLTELQRIAREESPHGIPLLIGRDVIHGFKTIQPIPLGQAATWNLPLIAEGARMAAMEATQQGVNWTFSPMLDVSRDPRWGRIAESFGEDPLLNGLMASAMVRGYQDDPDTPLMSCVKHFVGYGACESGRDYNTTNISENELRNVYLPPFKKAIDAGAMSLMTSFSDLNGMPPTGSARLLRTILRDEWGFEGFVVSDWESITQLTVHGVTENATEAAIKAAKAGVNMDMVSGAYEKNLESLVEQGLLDVSVIDDLVRKVVTAKFQLGLFSPSKFHYEHTQYFEQSDQVAKQLATESIVLLKNQDFLLPLSEGTRVALIGPMADQPYEQLGTWVFDADESKSVSLRQAFTDRLGNEVLFASGLEFSRDESTAGFDEARRIAEEADVVVLALGEEAILSGEAHCRASIDLPGAQTALLEALKAIGKPIVTVVLAGRPLELDLVVEHSAALLFAWHPGTFSGPAISDLLWGDAVPSGKLPVTMPRSGGQIPIYYAEGRTGKPATPETIISMQDIDARAPQTSVGNTSFHLDVHPTPLFPFGFGLSYTHFEYDHLQVVSPMRASGERLELSVELFNGGDCAGEEVAQLYIRDEVASATRPVRELKAFQKVRLESGERRTLHFHLNLADLSFHDGNEWVTEPGDFTIWVGGGSDTQYAVTTTILRG
jgi:beta-glucosidase